METHRRKANGLHKALGAPARNVRGLVRDSEVTSWPIRVSWFVQTRVLLVESRGRALDLSAPTLQMYLAR